MHSAVPIEDIPGDYQYRALHHGPRVQRFWHRNKLRVLQEAVSGASLDVIVDLGCGSGNLLFNSGLRPATLAVGLDASRGALRFCVEHRGARRAAFAQAVGGAVPLADNVADLVILVEVIEHLDDPAAVLKEIHRILKPGGRLFLTTPNYKLPSPWPVLEWLADHSGLVAQMKDAQHVQAFTLPSMRELLAANQFQIDRLGTMYLWSPLLSLVSSGWADRAVRTEVTRGIRNGALIHCLASKPHV
jgi:SAM-dependent methyltransferase